MSGAWLTVAALAVATAAIRASGPLFVGGRELPVSVILVIALLAPALLSALIVTQTFTQDGQLTLDARAAGLVAAGAGVALRAPLVVTVSLAALVTAGLRAVT